MSTTGYPLNACPRDAFASGRAEVVVVSGAVWNPCGHALLGDGRHYFHVAGVYEPPRALSGLGFDNYLRHHEKTVLSRHGCVLPRPDGARSKLCELLAQPWAWLVMWHNCASFVEVLLEAGGVATWQWRTNCPALEGSG